MLRCWRRGRVRSSSDGRASRGRRGKARARHGAGAARGRCGRYTQPPPPSPVVLAAACARGSRVPRAHATTPPSWLLRVRHTAVQPPPAPLCHRCRRGHCGGTDGVAGRRGAGTPTITQSRNARASVGSPRRAAASSPLFSFPRLTHPVCCPTQRPRDGGVARAYVHHAVPLPSHARAHPPHPPAHTTTDTYLLVAPAPPHACDRSGTGRRGRLARWMPSRPHARLPAAGPTTAPAPISSTVGERTSPPPVPPPRPTTRPSPPRMAAGVRTRASAARRSAAHVAAVPPPPVPRGCGSGARAHERPPQPPPPPPRSPPPPPPARRHALTRLVRVGLRGDGAARVRQRVWAPGAA
jgi:hypothetical protein